MHRERVLSFAVAFFTRVEMLARASAAFLLPLISRAFECREREREREASERAADSILDGDKRPVNHARVNSRGGSAFLDIVVALLSAGKRSRLNAL